MKPKGYMFITSSGYDPEKGKHVKDPYLGDSPTLGACMPNIRRLVVPGDHIFVVSGKVPGVQQFIIGGFEVVEKVNAMVAYRRFPELRLHERDDGQLDGNIICTATGKQHHLDNHNSFRKRIENYVIGRQPLALTTQAEIARGREDTLNVLRGVLDKEGSSPQEIMGRWRKLDATQIRLLREWLISVKGVS